MGRGSEAPRDKKKLHPYSLKVWDGTWALLALSQQATLASSLMTAQSTLEGLEQWATLALAVADRPCIASNMHVHIHTRHAHVHTYAWIKESYNKKLYKPAISVKFNQKDAKFLDSSRGLDICSKLKQGKVFEVYDFMTAFLSDFHMHLTMNFASLVDQNLTKQIGTFHVSLRRHFFKRENMKYKIFIKPVVHYYLNVFRKAIQQT
ncbi:hypothetical protein VNO77_22200 [Canavalia gladiata]|uniref:Uncharacterized protein n=1 Tax=Canavalia gladiata TaxID=3824 RepID=A0AAN9L5M9_CANGL